MVGLGYVLKVGPCRLADKLDLPFKESRMTQLFWPEWKLVV